MAENRNEFSRGTNFAWNTVDYLLVYMYIL
jgi:hypothetical protein